MPNLDPLVLDILKRLAEGIVAVVGPHCEIVVHDFGDLEHSVVAIAGNVTGRKAGAPVPDLSFTRGELGCDTPDQVNYHSKIGLRNLQSSTIFIRNANNYPIGAICINIDYSELLQVRDLLDKLTTPVQDSADFVVSDTFAKDIDELMELAEENDLSEEQVQLAKDMYEFNRDRIRNRRLEIIYREIDACTETEDLMELWNKTRSELLNNRRHFGKEFEDLVTARFDRQLEGLIKL